MSRRNYRHKGGVFSTIRRIQNGERNESHLTQVEDNSWIRKLMSNDEGFIWQNARQTLNPLYETAVKVLNTKFTRNFRQSNIR